MKICDLFNEMLTYFGELYSPEYRTCDTFKCGNPDSEIAAVGVSMFATPDVIRQCNEKNINFLIVHEPMFYNHFDDVVPNETARLKKELAESLGLTIARYHDYAHMTNNDMIYNGEIKYAGLAGKKIVCDIHAVNRYLLDKPLTARELASVLEKNLGIKHIRIAGCADKPGRKISCCFGTPGHGEEELEKNDFVLTGEVCEWQLAETARDYAQLGYNKAVLVMGHIGSERAGMRYLADILTEKHPEFKTEYIECGEVYSYTDQREHKNF